MCVLNDFLPKNYKKYVPSLGVIGKLKYDGDTVAALDLGGGSTQLTFTPKEKVGVNLNMSKVKGTGSVRFLFQLQYNCE